MINKYFYNISFTIIGIFFLIFLLTSLGFIVHIPVNYSYIIISVAAGLYYLKKVSDTNYDFLKQVLIIAVILLFSYMISLFFWDSTTDGRSYHLASVLLLKNGWNPIYDNINEVTEAANMYLFNTQWGNWYVKFCEIIGANIYNLTNHIESTKITNWLLCFTSFMYVFYVLNFFIEKKPALKFIISFITVINPVCICQILNNFIDINLYYAFTILVFSILKTEKTNDLSINDILVVIFSSVILSTCKFTGSVYLFVILFCWFIYRFLNKKSPEKILIISGLIIFLLLLTGINPYFTNIKNNGHPLHPVMGKNKTIVAEINLPNGFKNKNIFQKFIYGHFSESTNSLEAIQNMNKPFQLKIPFTITPNEDLFIIPDMRTGGFGYFWSGILVLTLIASFFIRFKNKEDKKLFFLILSMIIFTTAVNPHNWWARYVPQLWLLPAVIILFLNIYSPENKTLIYGKISFSVLTCFVICYNCFFIFTQNFSFNYIYKQRIESFYNYIKTVSKPDGIYLMQDKNYNYYFSDETIIPHLKEKNIKITEVPFDEEKIKEYRTLQPFYQVYRPCYYYFVF